MIDRPNLEVEIAGIKLKNPVMTASGTFGYGEEFSPFIDLDKLGAMVLKGITLKPKMGNPPPRVIETPSGMLNAIGLQNVGVERLIKEKLPYLQKFNTPAQAAEEAGADALSLINTLVGMAVDIDSRRPKLANISGGLSGPAVKPVALWLIWQVFQTVNIPVIGIGGIIKAEDALEFIIAGARAIEIGTANFVNPRVTIKIIEGIERYLIENNIKDINELVGSMKI
mgnify:CR=1 FL=1